MFRRKRSAKDFAEEIKAHLDLEADDLRGEGLNEEEARWKARREFGNVTLAQERFYLKDRWAALDNFVRGFRFAFRSLCQSPGFTVAAVLTLALGVGVNTAVFSVMNAVLLRSLPVADPDHVVYLRTTNPPKGTGTIDTNQTFSYAVFDALRRDAKTLSPVMAYVPLSVDKVAVRYGAKPESADGDMVSGNYFSGLGVKLPLGRGFTDEDERIHAPIVVLSHNYWMRRFAGDPAVLNQSFVVNGVPMTIVGVAAEDFEGTEAGSSTDFWIPLQSRPELNAYGNAPEDGKTYIANPRWWCLRLIARLAPGTSRAAPAAQLQPIFQRAAYEALGSPAADEKAPVLSFADAKGFRGYDEHYGKPLRMLMAMVTLVLVIALANVVMLLLARNARRQREFALREALGASRADLFRQLMVESSLLVVAGGALAWGFAVTATRLLANWAQIEATLAPDRSVVLFTSTVLMVAMLLFTLAPLRLALASGKTGNALKVSAATSHNDAGRSRAGKILVTLQLSLCLVLLVGAGLLVRTLRNLQDTSLGIRVNGLVVFGVKPEIKSVPQGVAFYGELMNKLRALPGVESVSVMQERIGSGWSNNGDMVVDGKLPDVAGGASRTVRSNVVGPNFFHTLGVPVLAGRDFAESDTAASAHVGIVNEEFARRFLPNQNPLGHTIGPEGFPFIMTIVGVVKNHKYRSIHEEPIPMAWYMYAQIPVIGAMHVEMRVSGTPLAILPSAQKVVQQLDPNLPLIRPMTQRAQYDLTISNQILFARLAGFFGILAVLLVATGLYGTLAYRVSMRTAEIGVRMAVGARRAQVVWMILRDSLALTAIAVLSGIPFAMLVGSALANSLYGVQPLDATSYAAAIVAVIAVALAASAWPATRAANIDPLRALRAE